MNMLKISVAAATLAMIASPAAAVTVDFQDLTPGTIYTSLDYEGVTFTNSTNRITLITSGSDIRICSSNQISCLVPLLVTFDQPSSGISFDVSGVNNEGPNVGNALLTFANGTTANFTLSGPEPISALNRQDLSAFSDITSILLTTQDPLGLSFDNFTFQAGAIPEPATWAMMIAGFGLVGSALRRRAPAFA